MKLSHPAPVRLRHSYEDNLLSASALPGQSLEQVVASTDLQSFRDSQALVAIPPAQARATAAGYSRPLLQRQQKLPRPFASASHHLTRRASCTAEQADSPRHPKGLIRLRAGHNAVEIWLYFSSAPCYKSNTKNFVLLALIFLLPEFDRAYATDATWNLNPTSSDWNTAANWTPNTVPTGTATFEVSNTTNKIPAHTLYCFEPGISKSCISNNTISRCINGCADGRRKIKPCMKLGHFIYRVNACSKSGCNAR